MRRRSLALASVLLASTFGCSSPREPAERPAPAASRPANPPPTATPPPPSATPSGSFTIDEWGLVAVVTGETTASAATGVLRHATPAYYGLGLGNIGSGYGGKPVIYVHLDPGVDAATFSLDLELGEGASVVEHWPPASSDGRHLRFADVAVRRGACEARTPSPSGGSSACDTADRFCEAAEIPRYEADHDVCMTVGPSSTDLLFYRASALDASRLPLSMSRGDEGLSLARGEGALDGPVLVLQRTGGVAHITKLAPDAARGDLDALTGEAITVDAARAWLVTEARQRGLTEAEADAFVDAWAPAYFDHCHRPGPEAHGHAPPALAEVERSVLYFAPRAVVDAMLPLRTTPAARATNRVFLVRLVDGTTVTRAPDPPPPPDLGHWAVGHEDPTMRPPMPVVRPSGRPEVNGNLSPDAVRRVVQRNINQLRFCYEQGLRMEPDLAGRIEVQFVISAAGAVVGSSVAENTLGAHSEGVASCFAQAFRRWQFPPPDPEGVASVNFTFELQLPR